MGGMVGGFVDSVNLGQTVKTVVFEGTLGPVADLVKSEPVLAGVLVVAVDTLELVDAKVQVGVDSLVMDELVEEILLGVLVVVDSLVMVVGVY